MRNDFENKTTKEHEVHYTRYYASWIRGGGDPENYRAFEHWLELLGLDREEISDIRFIAENGKLELEASVRNYVRDNPEDSLGYYLENKTDIKRRRHGL